MSGSWSGIMRAPRVKVPLLLPLLLLLLTALTGTVICQDDDDAPKEASVTVGKEPESNTTDAVASGEEEDAVAVDTPEERPVLLRHSRPQTVNNTTSEPVLITNLEKVEETAEGSGSDNVTSPTADSDEQSNLDPIMIIIPVVLVGLLICMIVCCILITCKWNKKKRTPDLNKEDPCLDGSSTEKVPMPMFEEDVPSVLELEMEELDQWMKKDGESTEDSKHV